MGEKTMENTRSPDFLGSWLKAPHQVSPGERDGRWPPYAARNSPRSLPLDLWCPDFHDPLSQILSRPWTLLLTQLFLKYFCLNTFNFTTIHKNKIKSKCITGLVWKVNIKINTMKRWPLNVNVHPLYRPEPSCTSPGIRFPSVGKDGAWDGGRRRVFFSLSGAHFSASNEKKEKCHCSFLPNCAHCVFQTALI